MLEGQLRGQVSAGLCRLAGGRHAQRLVYSRYSAHRLGSSRMRSCVGSGREGRERAFSHENQVQKFGSRQWRCPTGTSAHFNGLCATAWLPIVACGALSGPSPQLRRQGNINLQNERRQSNLQEALLRGDRTMARIHTIVAVLSVFLALVSATCERSSPVRLLRWIRCLVVSLSRCLADKDK